MYKRILVPLDGSKLAECVLPHVESIARGCNPADVTFIRVVEPVHVFWGMESDGGALFTAMEVARIRSELESENMAIAKGYLAHIAALHRYPGADVKEEVVAGRAAETIAEYAEKNKIDLIVIATHGTSGVSRWVWGSVADRVLRAACVPVLMIRAPGCIPGF